MTKQILCYYTLLKIIEAYDVLQGLINALFSSFVILFEALY